MIMIYIDSTMTIIYISIINNIIISIYVIFYWLIISININIIAIRTYMMFYMMSIIINISIIINSI